MKVLLVAVAAATMATTASAKQGDYVAISDGKMIGVYIVNTSDGSVRYCTPNGAEMRCTSVSK